MASLLKAKRTATGAGTSGLETTTDLPSITALASTNRPSDPATLNCVGGPPRETSVVGTRSNSTRTDEPSTRCER